MKLYTLNSEERLSGGFTHRINLTYEDLTETAANTAQTISLLSVAAGDTVKNCAVVLRTAFSDASDGAFNSTGITIGDGNDVDRFLALTEINDNATGQTNYADGPGAVYTVGFPVSLATITGAGDVVTNFVPGHRFRIEALDFITGTPVTTGSKLATLNAEIGTTNVTGGTVALTSAACTPLGAKVSGAAITGANEGGPTDTVSIEAASVTAFAEGTGVILMRVRNLDAVGAGFAYTASDTIDIVVNSMSGKALNDLDAGEVDIFLTIAQPWKL